MGTTIKDLEKWLERGKKEKDITHMIVVCDTFDYEDYPVYVGKKEDVQKVFHKYHGENMQTVMEVYSYKLSLKDQLRERRSFHFN